MKPFLLFFIHFTMQQLAIADGSQTPSVGIVTNPASINTLLLPQAGTQSSSQSFTPVIIQSPPEPQPIPLQETNKKEAETNVWPTSLYSSPSPYSSVYSLSNTNLNQQNTKPSIRTSNEIDPSATPVPPLKLIDFSELNKENKENNPNKETKSNKETESKKNTNSNRAKENKESNKIQ